MVSKYNTNELQNEKTMLQQFMLKHQALGISFDALVSMMSEFLLASFDTVFFYRVPANIWKEHYNTRSKIK